MENAKNYISVNKVNGQFALIGLTDKAKEFLKKRDKEFLRKISKKAWQEGFLDVFYDETNAGDYDYYVLARGHSY
jgi:hypothetical protein